MKIMSVDYGDSRTGFAVCDNTETLASPAGVVHEKQFGRCLRQVAMAAKEYGVGEIIVGNPINMNGTYGPRSQKCILFAEKLGELVDVPVKMWDERSTTISANNIMNELNRRGKKRRETVDAVAAAVILETYLAFRKNNKTE